jgi:hypothetical protein
MTATPLRRPEKLGNDDVDEDDNDGVDDDNESG